MITVYFKRSGLWLVVEGGVVGGGTGICSGIKQTIILTQLRNDTCNYSQSVTIKLSDLCVRSACVFVHVCVLVCMRVCVYL